MKTDHFTNKLTQNDESNSPMTRQMAKKTGQCSQEVHSSTSITLQNKRKCKQIYSTHYTLARLLMIPLTTLYDEYIGRPILTEQEIQLNIQVLLSPIIVVSEQLVVKFIGAQNSFQT